MLWFVLAVGVGGEGELPVLNTGCGLGQWHRFCSGFQERLGGLVQPVVKTVVTAGVMYSAYHLYQSMDDDHSFNTTGALTNYATVLTTAVVSKNTWLTLAATLAMQVGGVGMCPTDTIKQLLPDEFIEPDTIYRKVLNSRQIMGQDTNILNIREAGKAFLPPWVSLNSIFAPYDTPGFAVAVSIDGGIAYVADGSYGLHVFNVTDLRNITKLNTYPTPGYALGVSIASGIAYVADDSAGLHVLNVSDPRNLSQLGTYDTPGEARGVSVASGIAYVVDGNKGLHAINVSDPRNISPLGTYATPGQAWGVSIASGIAYVADYDKGLHVLNVSDPSNLSKLGTYATPGYALGVSIAGGIAYVADYDKGLHVLNVSDPRNLSKLGTYATPGEAWGVSVASGIAYVADDNKGLHAINVSDPGNMKKLATYNITGSAYGVTIADGLVFVAAGPGGVQPIDCAQGILSGTPPLALNGQKFAMVVDGKNCTHTFSLTINRLPRRTSVPLNTISVFPGDSVVQSVCVLFKDPDQTTLWLSATLKRNEQLLPWWIQLIYDPIKLGTCDTPGYAWGVSIASGIAYVADGDKGFHTIDVADPRNLNILNTYDTPGYAWGVSIASGMAYVAADSGGLHVLNVSDPRNLILLGTYDTPGKALGVSIASGIAYVADGYAGLYVLDTRILTKSNIVATYNTLGLALVMRVVGKTAYVIDTAVGLRILDISNIQKFTQLSTVRTSPNATAVDVYNNTAYVTASAGLHVIDVTNVTQPKILGNYTLPGPAVDVTITDGVAYVSTRNNEIRAFDIRHPQKLRELFTYVPSGDINSISVVKGIAYVAAGWAGLHTVDITPCSLVGKPKTADVGNYQIVLTATDVLGANVSDSFTIRVEGPPVRIDDPEVQYAKVGRVFSGFIPKGVFSDPNNDTFIFDTINLTTNKQTLPDWLKFNPISAIFIGTPPEISKTNYSIFVSATDNIPNKQGNLDYANTTVYIYVDHEPKLVQNIDNHVGDVGAYLNLSIPDTTFFDGDNDPLTYSAWFKNRSALPSWIQFNNLVFSGIPQEKDKGIYPLQITAKDPYNGTDTGVFDLIIEYFPKINQTIANFLTGVGRAFKYIIPIDQVFVDADQKDSLFISLKWIKSPQENASLPEWLDYDFSTHQFTGTPTAKGNYTINMQAKDVHGAAVETRFDLQVVGVPVIKGAVPTLAVGKEGRPVNYTFASQIMQDDDNGTLSYRLLLDNGDPIPDFLTFNPQDMTLTGMPQMAGNWLLKLMGINGYNLSTNISFPLVVNKNINPVVALPLNGETISIGTFWHKEWDMQKLFTDENNDTLTYDAPGLPNWLTFKKIAEPYVYQLAGTPSRSVLGVLSSEKIQPITIMATDDAKGQAKNEFNLKITGTPYGRLFLNIFGPIGTAGGVALTVFKNQDLILNAWNRWRGKFDRETVVLTQDNPVHKLSTPVGKTYAVQAFVPTIPKPKFYEFWKLLATPLPGYLLPDWLRYNVDDNTIVLRENVETIDDTPIIIRMTNRFGVIKDEFPIMAGGKSHTSTFHTQDTTTYSATYPASHNPYVYSE